MVSWYSLLSPWEVANHPCRWLKVEGSTQTILLGKPNGEETVADFGLRICREIP